MKIKLIKNQEAYATLGIDTIWIDLMKLELIEPDKLVYKRYRIYEPVPKDGLYGALQAMEGGVRECLNSRLKDGTPIWLPEQEGVNVYEVPTISSYKDSGFDKDSIQWILGSCMKTGLDVLIRSFRRSGKTTYIKGWYDSSTAENKLLLGEQGKKFDKDSLRGKYADEIYIDGDHVDHHDIPWIIQSMRTKNGEKPRYYALMTNKDTFNTLCNGLPGAIKMVVPSPYRPDVEEWLGTEAYKNEYSLER